MKQLVFLLFLVALVACDNTRTLYTLAPEVPHGYTVKVEIRECDGKLSLDMAALEIDGGELVLPPTGATLEKKDRNTWYAVLTFGEEPKGIDSVR